VSQAEIRQREWITGDPVLSIVVQDRQTADRVDTVADAVEMIFVWRRRVMYGREIVARTVISIGGRIAVRILAVISAGLIEPIKWLVNMAGRGETMPVRHKWIDQTDRRVLSDQNGHRDRSGRRDRNGPDATNFVSARP
jgi:hypothetical protein